MTIPKKNKITCLNDWRPVALTPIFSKCFEKLVREHICSVLPASLDPLQFAYRSNRSTDDAIAFTLHTALTHLENKNTYVRMLFVDYSSAFNTIASLLEVSFPPSRISTPGGVQGKPGGLSKTPATRPTDCSLCCPQGNVSAASDPALADWGTAFSLRLSG